MKYIKLKVGGNVMYFYQIYIRTTKEIIKIRNGFLNKKLYKYSPFNLGWLCSNFQFPAKASPIKDTRSSNVAL